MKKQKEINPRIKRQQKLRKEKELNKKYKYYQKELKKLEKEHFKKDKKEIPILGTHNGNLIYRYTQAIKAIEELAEKQNIKLKEK